MNEFETLLAGLVEETLTQEERQRLAELVQSDPALRARYLDHCNMHAALSWEHGVLGNMDFMFEPESEDDRSVVSESTIQWSRWTRPLAWAASIALICGIVWKGALPAARKSQWHSSDSIGSVVRKAGGELSVSGLDIQLAQGDSMKVGEYELTDGIIQFVFENDVEVLVEAPARFRVDSPLLMALHEGRLSAKVPPQGIGFTVETPGSDVIDHGTEFGVEVDSDSQSEIHVFDGVVEVKAREPLVESVRLITDQATRVDTVSGESSGIAIAPERFVRSFEEPVRHYSQEVRNLNPVVYYRMAISDDGITLLDRSGNDIHGRIERGEMVESAFAMGKIGLALRLHGVSTKAYAMVEDYPKATEGKLSVVGWVYAESRPTWASIAKNWALEGGQFHFGLKRYEGGLEVQIREADGGTVYVGEAEPLPLGEWQHVAFVADGEFVFLYRNGKEVAREPHDGLFDPKFPSLGIGRKLRGKGNREQEGTVGYWDGRIDELAIFNHALSAEDIKRLYLSPEKVAGLVSNATGFKRK
ncbi:FecR domain-containing protein [Opitutaceae bacterium]|nr:FecR domain-containing protein [Opitutaceae bacterium]